MESIQWQAFIKSCLDILRNGQSKFDGLKAINEFITLITLKLVENRISDFDENNDSDDNNIKIGLDCKITYLYNTYCKPNNSDKKKDIDKKTNELFDLLYNINRNYDIEDEMDDNLKHVGQVRKLNNKKECVIVRFNKYTTQLNKLTDNINDFKTITTFDKSHSDDVQKLIIKIHETFDNIDMKTFNYDAFGNAYEKIIAEELGNNSKRNGQYFTKRELIELIINELDIKPNHICYDPACGTGGFLLGFTNKFKDNYNFIKNNIYGREYLYEVYKILNFNILANNCDKAFQNITNGDSIRDDHYHKQVMNKFDIVGANPPFGVSIDTIPKDYPIKVKNSVACFLQHIYFSLKDGGKAGVIIDRGILNNGTDKKNCWEGKLRKFLLEKTNIYKIINLPTGIFKHTNFSTSVVFFVKGTPTKEVKYIEGYFKKEDKGKGDKKLYLGEENVISIKDIIDKNYSLKYDDYFKEQVVILEEDQDKWVKLGDIVKFDIGGTPSRKETKYYNGNHLWISVSELNNTIINDTKEKITDFGIKESSVKLIKKDSILMSFKLSIGKMGIAGKEMYCNEAIMFFKHDNDITNRYLYYYLLLNDLSKYASGQIGAGSLNKTSLYNILIPKLPLEHQNEIVKFLDEIYTDVDIDETIKYYKDKPIFNLLIEKRYEDFKDVIDYQPRIKFITSELNNIKKYNNIMVRSIFNKYRNNCETKKLGDICEIKSGKAVNKVDRNGTKYPYFASNGIIGYLDNFTHDNKYVICAQDGSIGSVHYYEGKIWASNHVWLLTSTNINLKYLYYIMKYYINYNNITTGNAIPKLTKYNLENIKVHIPSLEKQQEIVNIIKNTESPESHYNKYSKILKEELDNIMEIIGNMCILSNNNLELDENIINDNESEADLEIEIEDSEIEDSE